MFDIGFTELLTIGVVALIVIGPERLPKVARAAGHLYGRMQRYVSDVKSDISREMELDELRRTGQQFKESVESTLSDVQQQTTAVDDYLRDETASIGKAVSATTAGRDDASPAEEAAPQPAESLPQQNLPLDEPDQNVSPTPAAIVETVHADGPGKTA
jgi:sec-independent protein translocase protein TatB